MTAPRRPTLTARTPEDLLAMVPLVLGFGPHSSLVMLTFGAPDAFHARVDLPATQRDVGTVVRLLLDPVRRHRVPGVVFVVFGPDTPLVGALAHRLVTTFTARGVRVIEVLRAYEDHWFALVGRRWGEGVPYDVSAHPFVAEAVLQGVVTHDSREALAATVRPDPVQVGLVGERLARRRPAVAPEARAAEAAWVVETVDAAVEQGRVLRAGQVARLLRALGDVELRDAAWLLMSRSNARGHVELWTRVVRSAPDGLVAAPAALLGFAAWLSGHGALAWCALDRCAADDAAYPMAAGIAELLSQAVPPRAWEDGRAGPRPVPDRA